MKWDRVRGGRRGRGRLRPPQARLLLLLPSNPGRVAPRETLLQFIVRARTRPDRLPMYVSENLSNSGPSPATTVTQWSVQVGGRGPASALCGASVSAELEKTLGKPVIQINVASFWDALRRNGIYDKVSGKGSIIEEH